MTYLYITAGAAVGILEFFLTAVITKGLLNKSFSRSVIISAVLGKLILFAGFILLIFLFHTAWMPLAGFAVGMTAGAAVNFIFERRKK